MHSKALNIVICRTIRWLSEMKQFYDTLPEEEEKKLVVWLELTDCN